MCDLVRARLWDFIIIKNKKLSVFFRRTCAVVCECHWRWQTSEGADRSKVASDSGSVEFRFHETNTGRLNMLHTWRTAAGNDSSLKNERL